MQRVVVSFLKIYANILEMEAVEIFNQQAIKIYSNKLTHNNVIQSIDKFIYESKKQIEKIINGTIKEVILLIGKTSTNDFKISHLLINDKKKSLAFINNQITKLSQTNNWHILKTQKHNLHTKTQSLNMSEIQDFCSVSSISKRFYQEINEALWKFNLKLVDCIMIDDLKNEYYNQKDHHLQLNVELLSDKINLSIIKNNTIVKHDSVNYGFNNLVDSLTRNCFYSSTIAYCYAKQLLKDNHSTFINEQPQTLNVFNEFIIKIKNIISSFINTKLLQSETIDINLLGLIANNQNFENKLRSKLGYNKVYSLFSDANLLSVETMEVVSQMLNNNNEKSLLKTNTFIINTKEFVISKKDKYFNYKVLN
ncbi:Uncharacterised protein [Metamycoplasma cloacale]|uniref:Uncharacterized protein n=1 Tax=Metamycoplasma cloacale TaxID=92401 RepID=A0A2Z4LM21_9BACT|nr:hypothetical protein [Metamycoplasma cloacale]AWX42750.1 hypothetical protein DK849_01535 [Metamycoplasma cloacale]VEU79435.1 Uncharacterised protein [Metamycoplasma cloacale]